MDETLVDNNEFQLGLITIIFQLIDIFNGVIATLSQNLLSGILGVFGV